MKKSEEANIIKWAETKSDEELKKEYYDEDGNYRDNWCIYDAGKLYMICFSYSEAYELASNFVRECN